MSFGASIPVVGRAEPPEPGYLPLLAEIFLMVRSDEQEAVGPPRWFGRTRGSAGPLLAPLAASFNAGAGMTANGVLAMCSASRSTSMAASARFASEGSPSRANVDEASLNPARLAGHGECSELWRGGEQEDQDGGEEERRRRRSF